MENEKFKEETFEIRDLRDKDRFQIDDKFFNGYVKILGINALGVYCSLCRHANKEQKCWPSIKKIAEELSLSEPTIYKQINLLEKLNIIKRKRIGKTCNNRYWLLHKKEWKKEGVILKDLSSGDIKQFNITPKAALDHPLSSLISNKGITSKELINIVEPSILPKNIQVQENNSSLLKGKQIKQENNFISFYLQAFKKYINENRQPILQWEIIRVLLRKEIVKKIGYPLLEKLLIAYFTEKDLQEREFYKKNVWSLNVFLSHNILNKLYIKYGGK